MGIDIKSFTEAFIKHAENLINEGENNPNIDGVLDASEKKALPSVFALAFDQAKTELGGAPEGFDIGSVMGLEKTGAAQSAQKANAPRRAGEVGTNPIIINLPGQNVQVDVAVTVNINITADGGIDVDQLIEDIKKYIKQVVNEENNNQSAYLIAFITGLFEQISGQLDVDLSKVMEAINKVLARVNEVDSKIDVTVDMLKNMYKNLLAVMGDNFKYIIDTLKDQGQDIKEIKGLLDLLLKKAAEMEVTIENNHQEEMTAISKVYTLVQEISGDLTNLSAEMRNEFEIVKSMLEQNKIGINEAVTLLKLIKADTEQNNIYSLQIIGLVQDLSSKVDEGNKNIAKLITDYGDTIIQMLKGMNPTPVDLTEINEKLDAMMELLKTVDATTKETNVTTKEVLELVKKFPDYVDTITTMIKETNGNVEKVYNFLVEMEKKDREEYKAIMLAIKNLSTKVDDMGKALDHITETVDATYEIVKELKEKGINVDLSEVLAWLQTIDGKIDSLQMQDENEYKILLQKYDDLVALIKNINPGDWEQFGVDIKNMIKEGVEIAINDLTEVINNKNVDFKPIMDKMEEILAAIKDHHVEVKIDDIRIIDADGNEQTVRFTYVDCFPDEGQHAGARRAQEYELLLNFGKTSESDLDEQEKDILAKANANRPSVSGGTSGIAGVEADFFNYKGPVYDLQGRKVADNCANDWNSLPKGMYVIKGKKYIKE